MTVARISYLTDIYFGEGAVGLVPGILGQLGVRRPLVVTDPHLRSLGFLDRLPVTPAAVFDQVETNPEEEKVWEALDLYRENGCDGFIALGGGSPIDLAKTAALLVHHEPPLWQYAAVAGGWDLIEPGLPPLVAIPTTAGSGSEVGRAALVTLESGEKLGFLSPHLIPRAAVCDPELTVSMPAFLTAATGMDAISHCIETYCSTRENPVADTMALEGFRKAFFFLPKACADGDDPEARREMALAALLGGLTFQKGLGAVHSLSHPLGGLARKRLHHGVLNSIFLPVVLRFNQAYCRDRLQQLAGCAGLKGGNELAGRIEQLSASLGLPARLRDLGVDRRELDVMAERAFADHCSATNPRPLSVENCARLYAEAF